MAKTTTHELELLAEELLSAARKSGITIKQEPLSREVPGAKSGLAWVHGKPLLILDAKLSHQERIQLLARALGKMDLENIYLSPAARELIKTCAHKPCQNQTSSRPRPPSSRRKTTKT